jgi:hypothetical protein
MAGRVNFGSPSPSHRTSQNSLVVPPALFGDAFGTRGDYSKGVFYQGRMKFLQCDVDALGPNSLKPTTEFMSRQERQKQSVRANEFLKASGVRSIQTLDLNSGAKRDEGDTRRSMLHRSKSIKVRKLSQQGFLFPFQNEDERNWTREFQAGVHFWRHTRTGELRSASDVPWAVQNSAQEDDEDEFKGSPTDDQLCGSSGWSDVMRLLGEELPDKR